MADGSSTYQGNFLGGEWSTPAQGRIDDPAYQSAVGTCLNGIPIEEGAWVRRSGTQRIIPTAFRYVARLRLFQSSAACAFAMVFADGYLHFISGTQPIFYNDAARQISAASITSGILSITADASVPGAWVVGEYLMFHFPPGYDPALEGGCRGRVFYIASVAGAALTLKDDKGNLLTLPTFVGGTLLGGVNILRMVRFQTSWTAARNLDQVKVIQSQNQAIIVHPLVYPQVITVTEPVTGAGNDPTFSSVTALTLIDGPYLDPQGTILSPEGGTVSAYSGSITFTPTSSTFTSADVGRLIRIFTEPAAYNPGTSYSAGTTVTYQGQYWTACNTGPYATSNVGIPPNTLFYATSGNVATFWVPAVQAAKWGWGTITAQAGSSCTVTLAENLNSANGATVKTWALGVFKVGTYPTCGIYHEGRLWLAGAVKNRFDATMSNGVDEANTSATFSPSDFYGNVFDDHAIDETLNAKDLNNINWMALDKEGILCGTISGEWLIAASDNSDILTPTSVQSKRPTDYGSMVTEPVRAGIALLFVHRYARRVVEYLADAFSGKYSGRHLNEKAKQFSAAGIAELTYQEEPVPLLWHNDRAGGWFSCTYRRVSRFITEAPVFNGWAKHQHGATLAKILSVCKVPAEDGLGDRVYMIVQEASGDCFVEMIRPMPDASDDL
jgi:hypothetical protein